MTGVVSVIGLSVSVREVVVPIGTVVETPTGRHKNLNEEINPMIDVEDQVHQKVKIKKIKMIRTYSNIIFNHFILLVILVMF